MPELPEVETVVGDLRRELVGRTISSSSLDGPQLLRWPSIAAFASSVAGRQIEKVTRRGKYIQIGLGDELLLLVHLGMSGHLSVVQGEAIKVKHTHMVLRLDDGRELRYSDPRRFGRLGVGSLIELQAKGVLALLGPEPLDESFDLYSQLHQRHSALKTVLLNQKVLAGIGNIYADEALWRAGLRPQRQASSLSRKQAARLQQVLQAVLREAIAQRGSSIMSYRDARGKKGRAQEHLSVYGRAGLACLKCGRELQMMRLGGRSSVFCAHCQH